MSNEQTFKFRAECLLDVLEALRALPGEIKSYRIDSAGKEELSWIPDVEVTLTSTNMTVEDIRRGLAQIPDGHVMFETCQPVDLYTGERDFSS